MSAMASQITSVSTVNSLHKGPVTRKMFQFDDVIIDIVYIVGVHDHVPLRMPSPGPTAAAKTTHLLGCPQSHQHS